MTQPTEALPSWLSGTPYEVTLADRLRRNVPSPMKQAKRWLVHRAKKPHYVSGAPRSGTLDSREDVAQMGTFEQALAALEAGAFDGVGFALGDGWQGIDLDKVEANGLAHLVPDLPGYVERSPSGKGWHAIGCGVAFDNMGSDGSGLEAYCEKRFFTVTGDEGHGTPSCLAEFVHQRLAPLRHTHDHATERPTGSNGSATAAEWTDLASALATIPASCSRDEWVRVGMALKVQGEAAGQMDQALDMWDQWSQGDPVKYPGDRTIAQQWASFHNDKGATIRPATLLHIAQRYGWTRPAPDVSAMFGYTGGDALATPPDQQTRYKLRSAADLLNSEPIKWRVKGVIPERGIAALYGASGSGKSFLAIDLAMSIAKGGNWCGYRVNPCPVVYVCLEGEAGLSVRVKAYQQNKGPIPEGIEFIDQPLNLLNTNDVRDLVTAVRARSVPHGLVIVDTLNRAAPGMDENSSVDMGHAVNAAKLIQQAMGGLVLLVHHTGKDASKGMRGHSSLHAALDAAIEVRREGDSREWCISKAKDGADGLGHQFKLEVVDLGTDTDGDPITSCVVKLGQQGTKVKPLTVPQQIGINAFMEAALHNAPTPDDQRVRATLEQWRDAYYRRSGATTTDNKRRAFNRVRVELLDLGWVREADGLYQLVNEPNGFPDLS